MTTQENTRILEELAGQIDESPPTSLLTEAPEPGADNSTIINRGDISMPIPMMAEPVVSAGYTYVWDNQTGKQSKVNNNMVTVQLNKRRKDGSRVFTTIKPDFEPRGGQYKCLLHESNESRSTYDELGLPICTKDNLDSPYQVTRHMQTRHPQEWETIDDINTAAIRAEDREIQHALLQAVTRNVGVQEAQVEYEEVVTKRVTEPVVVQCEQCGEEFEGHPKMVAVNRLRAHEKSNHGGTDGQ